MKKTLSILLIAMFSLVFMGCGGEKGYVPSKTVTEKSSEEVKSGLPLTIDASSVNINTETTTNFQSKMTIQELYDFYKGVVPAMGYTEREITTVIEDNVLNLVFDQNDGDKSIVVQATPLGEGVTNVNIRYE